MPNASAAKSRAAVAAACAVPTRTRRRAAPPRLGGHRPVRRVRAALAWNFFGREAPVSRPMAEGSVSAPPPPELPPHDGLPSTVPAATQPRRGCRERSGGRSAAGRAPGAAGDPARVGQASSGPPAAGERRRRGSAAERRRAAARTAPAASTARAGGDNRVDAHSSCRSRSPRAAEAVGGRASYSNDAASAAHHQRGSLPRRRQDHAGPRAREDPLRSAVLAFKGYRYELNY